MNLFPSFSQSRVFPLPASIDAARVGMERWREVATGGDLPDSDAIRVLEALFGNSPFLTQCAVREPEFTMALLEKGPDESIAGIMDGIESLRRQSGSDENLARDLRLAKRRAALTIALADISGTWGLDRVTRSLSDLAEGSLRAAAAHLLRAASAKGWLKLPHAEDAERDSGLVILAMGKLGAGELNYSSDIDLIVLYDRERVTTDDPDALQGNFVRLTRNLVRLIDERTVDGYVFRTDLRLRPDPGSTPIALSTIAAETYYESVGQNWERAAMIKARPVAGDIEAGNRFIDWLKPFVWRKYLDFASIRDIHSIKRQINAHRGGSSIAVAGHNIKLGRGGIREIEFFAQTQQLIWGGREPRLRPAATLDALDALVAMGRTEERTADQLAAAYRFLRTLEHRLQMINDEQTQTLPEDDAGLDHLAVFMGYDGREAFTQDLMHHLKTVEGSYAELFEDDPSLAGDNGVRGNLVFTGSDHDPDTWRTLEAMGYRNPSAVDATVRGWHHARYRATNTTRAREILTELMPILLKSLADTPDPDAAFLKFDEFLSRLPSGVQLFSMIRSNPHLLELLADIMGSAPRLADHLSRRPSVLDAVLSADFTEPPPAPEELDEELDRLLAQASSIEDVLDFSRRWANDRRFQVGVQFLRGHLSPDRAAHAFSNLAETALGRLQPRIEEDFARRHGRFPGRGMAIIALGKLGGREMTPTSDLDMIFVFDAGPSEMSDGERPLPPTQYYARLSQRLINAVTAQTSEGVLYEVDMRLRPSGKAGPIAVSLESFDRYQHEEAWTWEHMALTRARVISGPPELRSAIEAIAKDVLTRPRDGERLLLDVAHMRERMDAEHHTDFIWEVKHLRGGLVDLEFIAQYLQLRHASESPEIMSQNTGRVFANALRLGILEPERADTLIRALQLWQGVQCMLRLTIPGWFEEGREAEVPLALRERLAQLGGCSGFDALKERMRETSVAVLGVFHDMISGQAAEVERFKE